MPASAPKFDMIWRESAKEASGPSMEVWSAVSRIVPLQWSWKACFLATDHLLAFFVENHSDWSYGK